METVHKYLGHAKESYLLGLLLGFLASTVYKLTGPGQKMANLGLMVISLTIVACYIVVWTIQEEQDGG